MSNRTHPTAIASPANTYRATRTTPTLHSGGFDMSLSRNRQITLSRFNRQIENGLDDVTKCHHPFIIEKPGDKSLRGEPNLPLPSSPASS
jgi:hypothetical protein